VPSLLRHFLRFLFRLGYFGPLVMGTMDSSFLFLPFGNDLLVTALVVRHHEGYWFYVLSATCGSTIGVLLLDVVARRAGEVGVQKVAGERRFAYLKRKISENGALALAVGGLAPPPFPFTMVAGVTSALGYPRKKLLAIVAASRAVRFLILGYLAIRFGRVIMQVANSAPFRWTVTGFAVVCVAGSAWSIRKWFRRGE
jgi:membrane protein YqaA with SNARE-associated domain